MEKVLYLTLSGLVGQFLSLRDNLFCTICVLSRLSCIYFCVAGIKKPPKPSGPGGLLAILHEKIVQHVQLKDFALLADYFEIY